MLKNLLLSSLLFLSATINATYVYEANQSLIDLTGATGTTNLGASDDGVSNAFNIPSDKFPLMVGRLFQFSCHLSEHTTFLFFVS